MKRGPDVRERRDASRGESNGSFLMITCVCAYEFIMYRNVIHSFHNFYTRRCGKIASDRIMPERDANDARQTRPSEQRYLTTRLINGTFRSSGWIHSEIELKSRLSTFIASHTASPHGCACKQITFKYTYRGIFGERIPQKRGFATENESYSLAIQQSAAIFFFCWRHKFFFSRQ